MFLDKGFLVLDVLFTLTTTRAFEQQMPILVYCLKCRFTVVGDFRSVVANLRRISLLPVMV